MDIDAVITWVNGQDPIFLKEKQEYEQIELGSFSQVENNGLLDTRFNNIEEVYYTILLIRKNLEWIKNIYLVTNGQKPSFWSNEFSSKFGVILITHDQMFRGYEAYLPTFNSRSIEAMLWNIPHIAEKFIYFNDDVFMTTQSSKKDFYHNSKIVARGGMLFKNKIVNKFCRLFCNKRVSKGLVGYQKESLSYPSYVRYFSPAHVPHPIIREEYKQALEGRLKNIIQYKFRNKEQSWPIGLFYNYMANQKKLCKTDPLNIDWEYISQEERLESYLRSQKDKKVLCVQSIEEYSDEIIKKFIVYLEGLVHE